MTPEPDLPRWNIAFQAWRLLIENSGAALRMAVLPFLILMAVHRLIDLADPAGLSALSWMFFKLVVFPIPAALLLVPWYRHILSARWPALAARPAHWWYATFMARTLGLEFMLFVMQLPSAIAGLMAVQSGGNPDPQLARLSLFLLLALAPGFYFYARAALALPAAAAGGDHSYGRSWRVTGAAGWRIATLIFILWFTFIIIGGLALGPPAEGGAPVLPPFLASAISAAIDVVRELVMAAALALVYLHYNGAPVEDVVS
jgi:hypothetical protein